ncbi:MAG: hemerythrin domain-containing protein [Byssovorax sp.]
MTNAPTPPESPRSARRPTVATENFRRQHAELFTLAAEIGGRLTPDGVASGAAELRRLLAQLAGRLNVHARMENDALYPRLLSHHDARVRDQAQALFDEVGGIYAVFGALLNDWPSAAEMEARPADFVRQTMKVFRLLGKRMLREENELYPMVDAIE